MFRCPTVFVASVVWREFLSMLPVAHNLRHWPTSSPGIATVSSGNTASISESMSASGVSSSVSVQSEVPVARPARTATRITILSSGLKWTICTSS